ncbi:alpha-1,2-fucosyltransferase [Acidimicrobiaceae bacterium]|nr:alpha-1,2-fucosyltransferase [Acidimicrobiaceae bacterium]
MKPYILKIIEIFQRLNLKNNIFYQEISEKNYDTKKRSMITFYKGHWQDSKYLDKDDKSLFNKLSQNINIKKSLESYKNESVMIHMRRKRYENKVLSIEYYLNAINMLEEVYGDIEFNLFTDDKDIIEELPFKEKLKSINVPSNGSYDTIKTFAEMLNNKHFIIANSTFSYMAALIGSVEGSKVIMPKPWLNNLNINLKLDEWIEIDCQFEL